MHELFRDSPTIWIVEWMIANQEYDHSLKEIASGAEMSPGVAKRKFEPLLSHGVVRVNRTVGSNELYVLDLLNRCTKAIIEFDKQIAKCCEVSSDTMEPEDFEAVEMGEICEPLMVQPLEL